MRNEDRDFEFERRFLVSELPAELLRDQDPDVIVQTYFLAKDGYGLRIRLQATRSSEPLPLTATGKLPLQLFSSHFDLCLLTVKGPANSGTRYEAERELDVGMGIEMCLRGGLTLSKRRFGVWLDQDGWVLDQFCGENTPLIIAECERTSPVVDLAIPSFCRTEVTDDYRFSNDSLVHRPFGGWATDYYREQAVESGGYLQGFGDNNSSYV